MLRPWLIQSVLAVLLSSVAAVPTAIACGGVKAFIAEEMPATGMRQVQGPNNVTLYYDSAGNALLPASTVQVDSALAEAIAQRYLASTVAATTTTWNLQAWYTSTAMSSTCTTPTCRDWPTACTLARCRMSANMPISMSAPPPGPCTAPGAGWARALC